MDMSEFDAHNRPVFAQSKVDIILEQLGDSERGQQLRVALADRSYYATAIARVLNSWGFDISSDSVQKWRKQNERL